MRDSQAGIVGGFSGSAVNGFMANKALKSGLRGGLAGLAGAALSGAAAEALRAGNDCECGQ